MSSSRRSISRQHWTGVALCGPLILLAPILSQASVQARLERGAVNAGGALTLDIESDGAPSGAQPDLAPLQKDFVVLGSEAQSETSFVNGRRSDRLRWSVRLQPRHAGKLVVPAITLGNEQTDALDVDVAGMSPQAAAQVAKHVFVEVEAGDAGHRVYVQQQTPYTVRLYYDDTIQKGELVAPNAADAVVEQLGADKHGTAVRDGRSYNVLERTYAIAPEKSGTLRIDPVSFSGSQVLAQSGQAQTQSQGDDAAPGNDLFARMLRQSPLANDPLFKSFVGGAPFAEATQPVAVQGREVVLDVKARPAAAHADWLPADSITLHDSWQDQPPQLKAGEPATRTITIEAKGLSASQIPPLSLAQPADARMYPEAADNQSRTDGKTIFGISTQKVTYIPNAQGTLEVPAVELAWWDVGSDESRRAVLPALSFSVAPGVASDLKSGGSTGLSASALAAPAAADDRLPSDARTWQSKLLDRRVSLVVGVLLAGLLVALAILRRLRAGSGDRSNAAAVRAPARVVSPRALQQACAANDRHAATTALLDLARMEWPDDPPRSLGALASRLEAGAAEVSSLERSLYGAGEASTWKGGALWHVTRRGLRPRRSDVSLTDDGLTDLYPLPGQLDRNLRSI